MADETKRTLTHADVVAIADELEKRAKPIHQCRFTDEEARLLHQFREDVDRDTIIILGWFGKTIRTTGMWIARLILIGIVGAGIAVVYFLSQRGLVKLP